MYSEATSHPVLLAGVPVEEGAEGAAGEVPPHPLGSGHQLTLHKHAAGPRPHLVAVDEEPGVLGGPLPPPYVEWPQALAKWNGKG